MIQADVALFTGLGQYFTGIAQIQLAELESDEAEGLRRVAPTISDALEHISIVRQHEERILALAGSVEYSAYFVRRHEVVSQNTDALYKGLEAMVGDLRDGYYPAAACAMLNRVLSQMMSNFEHDAQIEGVLNRFEGRFEGQSQQ